VTAADLQLAERHGGDCEDVESFAVKKLNGRVLLFWIAILLGVAGHLKAGRRTQVLIKFQVL
jgi:hypothetical protein